MSLPAAIHGQRGTPPAGPAERHPYPKSTYLLLFALLANKYFDICFECDGVRAQPWVNVCNYLLISAGTLFSRRGDAVHKSFCSMISTYLFFLIPLIEILIHAWCHHPCWCEMTWGVGGRRVRIGLCVCRGA